MVEAAPAGAQIRRRHGRVKLPVEIRIGQEVRYTDDWSIGGFSVPGSIAVQGDAVAAHAVIPYDGLNFAFTLSARRVFEADNRTGFKFVQLSESQMDMLRALIIGDVSGQAFPLEQLLVVPRNARALQEARATGHSNADGFVVSAA